MPQTYPPLALIEKSQNKGEEFSRRKLQFIEAGVRNAETMTEAEYVRFFLSRDFLDDNSNHHLKDITLLFKLNVDTILAQVGMTVKEAKAQNMDIQAEFRDLYLAPVLIERWSKAKQVFKPDPEFADALLNTKKLEFSRSMLEHLPCDSFYIDVSDCTQFQPIVGVFTFVNRTGDDVSFTMYLLTDELIYFSFYIGGTFDQQGMLRLDLDSITDHDYNIHKPEIWAPQYLRDAASRLDTSVFRLSRKSIYIFAMQMICYLTIEEPDLLESPLTKGTYRPAQPGSRVRNKWSEVKIEDVGVRYGTSFRKKYKEVHDALKLPSGKKRKSPIPHFRCAHWQHFWVGKGRKECVIRWIEPSFVSGEGNTDVVIHAVKEETA